MTVIRPMAILLLATIVGLTGLGGCKGETTGPERGVTVRDIQKGREGNPENTYAGKTVTVSADVRRVLGGHAFSIAGARSTVEPLLVVHDSDVRLNENDPIQITGVVRTRFDIANVEHRLNFEFDHDVFSDYRGSPYIEAKNIESHPE